MDILLPSTGRGPGVLVAHPWWGLNQTIRDYGAALAREGFVVGLPDLFDGSIATTIPDAETQMRANFETGGTKIEAALRELAGHAAIEGDGVGAVGFSYGGFHLLSLAATPELPLRKAVIYYATYPMEAQHVPLLAHLAENDPYESTEDMDALRAALKPPSVAYTYPGTQHWFAESDRPEFDAAAAKLAFERTVKFLRT